MKICVLLTGSVLPFTPVIAEIIDVQKFIGKPPEATETILGKPLFCNETYRGLSCDYTVGDTQVIYINGKADWITVSSLEKISFDHMAIQHIGLTPAPPLVRNPFRMHWESHQGLAVISVYGSGKYVAFIQVRAFTPK